MVQDDFRPDFLDNPIEKLRRRRINLQCILEIAKTGKQAGGTGEVVVDKQPDQLRMRFEKGRQTGLKQGRRNDRAGIHTSS